MDTELQALCSAGGEAVVNIEGLRCGGAPARRPELPEPVDPVFEWPDDDRPDDPVMAQLGEGLFIHRHVTLHHCGQCGSDYISSATLAAHRERDHSSGDGLVMEVKAPDGPVRIPADGVPGIRDRG